MERSDDPQLEIIVDADDGGRDAMSERLAGLWWTFVVRGVIVGLIGFAALFWPTGSISVLLQFVGFVLLLDGALALFGLRRHVGFSWVGLGGVLIGLILLLWPEETARIAFFLVGAWAAMIGIGSLLVSHQMPPPDPEKHAARSIGLLSLLVGLILIFWPGSGLVALGWAVAFAALALCALLLWQAAVLRRARERLKMRVVG